MTDKPKNNASTGRVIRLVALAIVGFLSMVALCVGGLVYVLIRTTQPAADVASEFLQAVADENDDRAFSLLTDGAQSEYGTAVELGTALREASLAPQRWSWNNRSVDNETATVRSTVKMTDGGAREVEIRLIWSGSMWLISGFTVE